MSRAAGTRAHEDQLPAVGRERGLVVVRRIVGEPLEPGPVGSDAKQIGGSAAFGGEHDRRPVGRPGRIVIDVTRLEEGTLAAAVGGGNEQADLAGVWKDTCEGDPLKRRLPAGHDRSGHGSGKMHAHRRILLPQVAAAAGAWANV